VDEAAGYEIRGLFPGRWRIEATAEVLEEEGEPFDRYAILVARTVAEAGSIVDLTPKPPMR
jgi:hypothetical protein